MVNKKTSGIILFLIVALALAIRLVGLTRDPPGMNWDEVSHAYTAYSLLFTGRDQWSRVMPVFNFRAYGDYPTTLNAYMTVPSIAFFGPTDFAVRLPHALIGALTVLLGYIAVFRWRRDRLAALAAAFILAFSPWTFFLSRQVLQSNWAVFLLTIGAALYYSGFLTASVLIFGLSLFAYHNTRIFVPLLLPFLILNKNIRTRSRTVFAVLLVLAMAGGILWLSQSRARGSWVGILDQGAIASIEVARNNSSLPPALARALYNRPVYLIVRVFTNYLGYFSPRFLFFSGGTQYQFSLPGYGVLNLLLLPFFYFGVLLLLYRRQWFLLGWLALSPLPAAITRDQYAVVRASCMIPAVVAAAAVGLSAFMSWFRSRRVRWAVSAGLLFGFIYFAYPYFYNYIYLYPWYYSQSWQSANRQMVELARQKFPEYDQIIITKKYGEPHEFILWYWPWNPGAFQTDPSLKWDFHDDWYWVDGFSKFMFVNDWDMVKTVSSLPPGRKYLVFSGPENQPNGAKIGQINYLDGTPAYIVKAL